MWPGGFHPRFVSRVRRGGKQGRAKMARSIVGLFNSRGEAESAISDLIGAGVDSSRIGILLQDKGQTREVVEEYGTRSGETAVAGGIVGGTAGALLAATGAL